ncbi:hypothetical protein JJL45_14605 [Tamlana sp. s12]|uniref:hypothetical protein n=1 Tax=Tamlana sp. s12 TaxID=1630406 RepID=UPI0007FE00EA|nr:hypothetical protein [Tamlana sp. s12]OBQ54642.1 hypothetical protein VQ01_10870 [Tamlana sp. s12]QQY82138.1 hypothetical protein JJL45_14605 [Tamlana sp. s12]
MTIEALVGNYTITGHNQNAEKSPYKGKLSLSLDAYKRIKAEWTINDEQLQWGVGVYKDHILVINFHYKGDQGAIYNGVVVYKCITENILEGFWYEEHGDPEYLGHEQCIKTISTNTLFN